MAGHEVAGEERDVVAALAERRQARSGRRSAGSRGPRGSGPAVDLGVEVAVGRGDDAHVDVHAAARRRRRGSRPPASTRRSFAWKRGRRLADLVEEERAAVGDLEEALLVGDGAGEGAAAWPKSSLSSRLSVSAPQFCGDEEALAAVPPKWMARATSSLPVPVSPCDEHRGRGRRVARRARSRCDRGAASDDGSPPRTAVRRLFSAFAGARRRALLLASRRSCGERAFSRAQVEGLDRALRATAELGAVPGLGDVAVDRALVDAADERLDVGVAGEDDRSDVGTERARARRSARGPTSAGHALVGDARARRRLVARTCERARRRRRRSGR